jgi:hypothetical protein
MEWQLTVRRDGFEAFDPELPRSYRFVDKWRFILWSLERQVRRLAFLRHAFMDCIARPDDVEVVTPVEDVRLVGDDNATNVLNALADLEIRFIGGD